MARLTYASFFALVALLSSMDLGAEAILCYRCDATKSRESRDMTCPGWHRRPVDSLRDLGDRGGLYSHCVDVRLANGTVLDQGVHPLYPTCVGDFLSIWREKLVKEYKQDVSVICCEWNRCNGPNATASQGPESHFVLHLIMAVIIWTRQRLAEVG